MSDERITLTYDEAVAALPDLDFIHTFMQAGPALIGPDWPRAKLLDALKASPDVSVTGPGAQAMHHGLAIKHPERDAVVFVETIRRTDEGLNAAPDPDTASADATGELRG